MTALGTYSFLPWLRNGIAGSITAVDLDPAVTERATVQVDVTISGTPIAGAGPLTQTIGREVQLYGPGDIVGLDSRAIVRVEPRHLVTTFEPNYLAHLEFYDEDKAWRYTPAAPGSGGMRLRPWIALAVLTEDEFEERVATGRPLPSINVPDSSVLPVADDLWAWAHVHINRSLAASETEMRSTDMAAVLPRLGAVLTENPDLACSRIICPRRLAENTAYHAFVIPVFESGRLAGLGHDPSAAPHATFSAWATYPNKQDPSVLPIYHRWYFRTGSRQDFESLVRLLEPRTADHRVGTHDMDVQRPGAGLPGITDLDLGGILRLGGALRVPRAVLTEDQRTEAEHYDHWADPQPHPFQSAMAATINLTDDYAHEPAATANAASAVTTSPDPVLTMPLYGRWHALQQRLLRQRNGTPVPNAGNWVHDLNLDPRHRVAAGFGTLVVQQNQEDYMAAAWNQLGDVLEANRRIRLAQLAKEVGAAMHRRHLESLVSADAGRALALTAPVQARVVVDGSTIRHQRESALLQPALTSTSLRKMTRPRGPIARLGTGGNAAPGRLVARAAIGQVTAAPPKLTPPALATTDMVAAVVKRAEPTTPGPGPAPVRPRPGGLGGLIDIARSLLGRVGPIGRPRALRIRPSETLLENNLTPAVIRELPEQGEFRLVRPVRDDIVPIEGPHGAPVARRFKAALGDWSVLAEASRASASEPSLGEVSVAKLAGAVVSGIDPRVTVPKRVLHGVRLPPRLVDLLGETFQQIMAYPRLDLPMYAPLAAISSELFLPNLNLVEQNSITLLETNQEFIEAYMVGLNHELARELLWREYPTDQRGSPFRQFWDVRTVLDTQQRSADALREALYDIPELHRWLPPSNLGDHDNRERPGASEDELVLLIRGELLKKYPTAVIYAHRADWQRKPNGSIDPTKERVLATLTAAEEEHPPPEKVLTPLFEAKVEPDCYFFGFDLTAAAAKGGTGEHANDDAGWFFVIKERPGEPRFGLDIERKAGEQLNTFNDLAWSDAAGVDAGDHLAATMFGSVALQAPGPGDVEKTDQHNEDVDINAAPRSSARWAYILYQAPVMVAVHAAEMLRVRS